jgi:hypothetical protein
MSGSSTAVVNKILISSAQRNSSVSNGMAVSSSNFSVTLDNALQGRYQLDQIQIPNTAFNVYAANGTSSGNNTIYFSDSGGNHSATIASAYYTSAALLTAIAAAMNGASGSIGGYNLSQDSNSNIVTVTNSGNFQMKFASNTSNSIAAVIGFTNVDTVSGTSSVGTYPLNLRTIQNYFIVVSGGNGGVFKNVFGSNQKQYTFIVPVLVNTLDIIFFSEDYYKQQIKIDSPEKILTITIVDINGNLLNIQNVDWNFILSPLDSYSNTNSNNNNSSNAVNVLPSNSNIPVNMNPVDVAPVNLYLPYGANIPTVYGNDSFTKK